MWLKINNKFLIITSLCAIVVTDCWQAYSYHIASRSKDKDIPIKAFAKILDEEILKNNDSELSPVNIYFLTLIWVLPGENENIPQYLLPGNSSLHLCTAKRGETSCCLEMVGLLLHITMLGRGYIWLIWVYLKFTLTDMIIKWEITWSWRQTMDKRNCCKWCVMRGVKSLSNFYCEGYNAWIWNYGHGEDQNRKLWSE